MLEHFCAWAEPMFVLIAEKGRVLQEKKNQTNPSLPMVTSLVRMILNYRL